MKLSDQKKTHEDEVRQIEAYINEFASAVNNKDIMGALSYFAEFAGMSPLDFKQQLKNTLYPQYEQYSKMDENQRKFAEIQEENEYLKWKHESETKRSQMEQSNKELQERVAKIQGKQLRGGAI